MLHGVPGRGARATPADDDAESRKNQALVQAMGGSVGRLDRWPTDQSREEPTRCADVVEAGWIALNPIRAWGARNGPTVISSARANQGLGKEGQARSRVHFMTKPFGESAASSCPAT